MPEPLAVECNKVRKILLIQYQPFGDVLLNTAYLPALSQTFPEASIDFLVAKPYHKVLEGNPYIDNIVFATSKKVSKLRYIFDRIKLFVEIYHKRYDLVIDQMRGIGSGQIVLFSRARYRLGFENSRLPMAYNIKAKIQRQGYSASMKFDLLRPLGIKKPENYQLLFYVRKDSDHYITDWLHSQSLTNHELVCISPGSPVKKKMWLTENYAKLADLIVKNTDCRVILLWGPDEKHVVDTMTSCMNHLAFVAPPTDFNQAAAMLKKCSLLICNDGGLNHLSASVETPSIAIFGNTNPANWSPDFPGHHYLFNPGFDSRYDNSFGISPEQVFDKLVKLI